MVNLEPGKFYKLSTDSVAQQFVGYQETEKGVMAVFISPRRGMQFSTRADSLWVSQLVEASGSKHKKI